MNLLPSVFRCGLKAVAGFFSLLVATFSIEETLAVKVMGVFERLKGGRPVLTQQLFSATGNQRRTARTRGQVAIRALQPD